jgi:hypothetical protein
MDFSPVDEEEEGMDFSPVDEPVDEVEEGMDFSPVNEEGRERRLLSLDLAKP